MAAIVVIPARFGSTRFPAKIVASETGRPLVQHVVDQVAKCRRISDCVVATDDARVADALVPFNTRVVMTDARHQSGTDRVAEVMKTRTEQIVVNVQGDEPEIEPEIIDALVDRLESTPDDMATAATAFPAGSDVANPNLVKVVLDGHGRALYFSRSPVPFYRDATAGAPQYLLHLGIYAYRREFLLRFAAFVPTPLEQAEKLEQLRALEHGSSIFVLKVDRATHGIDTAEQYNAFVIRHKAREKGKL